MGNWVQKVGKGSNVKEAHYEVTEFKENQLSKDLSSTLTQGPGKWELVPMISLSLFVPGSTAKDEFPEPGAQLQL